MHSGNPKKGDRAAVQVWDCSAVSDFLPPSLHKDLRFFLFSLSPGHKSYTNLLYTLNYQQGADIS